jgi:hypothetical protein
VVLAVPSDWAKKIQRDYDGSVTIKQYNDLLFVQPSTEYYRHRQIPSISTADPHEAENIVISAYLGGADTVQFEVPKDDTSIIAKLEQLDDKLNGMYINLTSAGHWVVNFTPLKVSIPKLLDTQYGLYSDMYELVLGLLRNYPAAAEQIQAAEKVIARLEPQVDRDSFYAKRLLVTSLTEPESMPDLDIAHPSHTIAYSTIESNLERLADHQEEIFKQLKSLNACCEDQRICFDLSALTHFYELVHEIVAKAYKEREEFTNQVTIAEQAAAAEREYGEVRNWLEFVLVGMKDVIPTPHDPSTSQAYEAISKALGALWNIAGLMWAMVERATNISEAALFILGTIDIASRQSSSSSTPQ